MGIKTMCTKCINTCSNSNEQNLIGMDQILIWIHYTEIKLFTYIIMRATPKCKAANKYNQSEH